MKATFSGAAGLAFAAVFRGLKILRPDRPIHPHGVALAGTIERQPGTTGSGIRWADVRRLPATPDAFRRALALASGEADTTTRLDPVAHPLPGAGTYRWANGLRLPAYAAAREHPGNWRVLRKNNG